MKAHQRLIREKEAEASPREIVDLSTAEVREISFAEARKVILKFEWLGNMGTTERAFGLFLRGELAGVTCFGKTAGTHTFASVAGKKWEKYVTILCRGACVHWAHEHAGSFLITRACQLMTKEGIHIFVAYSDTDAGEIGTIYQSLNWLYCGQGSAVMQFSKNQGKLWQDTKLIHSATRDRTGRSVLPDETGRRYFVRNSIKYYAGDTLPDGTIIAGGGAYPYIPRMTRAEKVKQLNAAGAIYRKGTPKHRYVGIYTDNKRMRREILKDMKTLGWAVQPVYPKRVRLAEGALLVPPEEAVRSRKPLQILDGATE